MINEFLEMKLDVEQLKWLVSNMTASGPVVELDAKKGYRIELGLNDDGQPLLSPWLPHPETSKSSVPLEVDQMVGIFAPAGDLRQGLMVRGGYSKDHETPNEDMNANVFEHDGVRISVKEGKLIIEIGDNAFAFSAAGFRAAIGGFIADFTSSGQASDGGKLTHNGKDVGDTHKHKDSMPGPSLTGVVAG